MATGEYIAPEKIENIINSHPNVLQSFVYGDTLAASVVSIIVIDSEFVTHWANINKLSLDVGIKEICIRPSFVKEIMNSLTDIQKKAGLHSFEQVKAIRIVTEPFTVENDLLTPTFKPKRSNLTKYYFNVIKELYDEVKKIEQNSAPS